MDSTSPMGLGRAITSAGRDAGDLATLVGGVARVVGAVVPFDGYCLLTMDPESMLPTGHWMEAGLSDFRRVSENEYLEDDVHKFQDLAGAAEPVGVLGEGRPETGTSSRYADILRPAGFGAELRVVARDASGCWGALVLLRERGRRGFTAYEARTVAGISGRLASVLRRGQLTAAEPLRAPGEAIGLLILDERNRIRTVNAQARAWLAQLEDAEAPQLAHVVYGVANRARNADDGMASTRAPTSVGGWIVLTATVLDPTVDDGVAVVLRPATRPELVPLLLHAFGLTPRERQVMQLMAQGRSTQQAARLLGLSPYTVTDHLRSIYAKTGVTSRQELQVLLLADR